VDRLEKSFDGTGVHGVPACEFVGGLEPVDAPVLSRDEAVEARRHVDRHARIRVGHGFALTSRATTRRALGSPLRSSPSNAESAAPRWSPRGAAAAPPSAPPPVYLRHDLGRGRDRLGVAGLPGGVDAERAAAGE